MFLCLPKSDIDDVASDASEKVPDSHEMLDLFEELRDPLLRERLPGDVVDSHSTCAQPLQVILRISVSSFYYSFRIVNMR